MEETSGWKKIEDKWLMPNYMDDDLHGANHQQIQE